MAVQKVAPMAARKVDLLVEPWVAWKVDSTVVKRAVLWVASTVDLLVDELVELWAVMLVVSMAQLLAVM